MENINTNLINKKKQIQIKKDFELALKIQNEELRDYELKYFKDFL